MKLTDEVILSRAQQTRLRAEKTNEKIKKKQLDGIYRTIDAAADSGQLLGCSVELRESIYDENKQQLEKDGYFILELSHGYYRIDWVEAELV